MYKVSAAFPHSARWGWLLPVLALCATPAQSAESGAELETVIVTAQKRSESVQDIPLSISVLNTEQLEDRGFSGTSDLAKLVPGFSFVQTGVNAPVYSIRGVGFYETSLASSPAVSVYVDEVSLPYPAMTAGAALDVERVEVLKGPQGTLYGQNSTGGLVNYISRKPTDSFESGVRASIARFGLYELEGYLSGPLTETLNGRLAVQSALGDDWQRSISRNEENGEVERTAARLLLDWRPTDDLSLLLNVNGWIDRSDTTAPRLIAVTPNNAARLLPIIRDATLVSGADPRDAEWNPGQNLYRDDKLWQASLKAAWSFREGLTLTSITAFTNYDTEAYNERDGTPYENSEYPTVGSIESFAQELRLDGEVGGVVRWVAGANYFNDTTSDNQLIRYRTASNVQSVNGFPFTVGLTRANQEIESYAAFLSADWTLSERLTLTTGARYTQETRKLEACSYSTDPNQLAAFAITSRNNRIAAGLPPAPFVPVDDCFTLNEVYLPDLVRKKLAEDNVSWRLALGWTATDDVLVYASVSEGFKSGSFPTQGSSSEAQYRAARQENVLAYEAGVKTTLFARTLQLNGSVFYYDYENKQTRGRVIDAVFGPLQALVNIPKSSSQGAELDATWRVTQGLTLYGGVAYTKSEIDTYLGYTQLGQRLDFAGRSFSFTPEWQAVADVSYTWPLRGDLIASVGLGAAHKSRSSADSFSSPLFDIDAYTLLDARAKLAGSNESWSVELWVRNLTDEYYWTNVFKATDTTVQLPAYPMSYGATLRYRFR